jgi:hypothetical protein
MRAKVEVVAAEMEGETLDPNSKLVDVDDLFFQQ